MIELETQDDWLMERAIRAHIHNQLDTQTRPEINSLLCSRLMSEFGDQISTQIREQFWAAASLGEKQK